MKTHTICRWITKSSLGKPSVFWILFCCSLYNLCRPEEPDQRHLVFKVGEYFFRPFCDAREQHISIKNVYYAQGWTNQNIRTPAEAFSCTQQANGSNYESLVEHCNGLLACKSPARASSKELNDCRTRNDYVVVGFKCETNQLLSLESRLVPHDEVKLAHGLNLCPGRGQTFEIRQTYVVANRTDLGTGTALGLLDTDCIMPDTNISQADINSCVNNGSRCQALSTPRNISCLTEARKHLSVGVFLVYTCGGEVHNEDDNDDKDADEEEFNSLYIILPVVVSLIVVIIIVSAVIAYRRKRRLVRQDLPATTSAGPATDDDGCTYYATVGPAGEHAEAETTRDTGQSVTLGVCSPGDTYSEVQKRRDPEEDEEATELFDNQIYGP